MFNKATIKKLLYTFGKILGLAALVYILYKLHQEYTVSDFLKRIDETKGVIVILFILNIVSNFIGVYGWHSVVHQFAHNSFVRSFYYYEKTDISKYLPGNIFHLVGRQALASKLGLSQMSMAKVATVHTIMILIATIASATLLALFADNIHGYIKLLLAASTIASVALLYVMFPSLSFAKKLQANATFTLSVALHGVMLGILICYLMDNWDIALFLKVGSIYIISWLVGFVTPGASGGLGVREGAFIAILQFIDYTLPEDIVFFAILLIRLVNIFSDILMYLFTYFIAAEKIERLPE